MNATSTATVLNELIARDPYAISKLVAHGVTCNEQLADHATVMVRSVADNIFVGIMGVLNGILLKDDDHLVVAVWNNNTGRVDRFETRTRAEYHAHVAVAGVSPSVTFKE